MPIEYKGKVSSGQPEGSPDSASLDGDIDYLRAGFLRDSIDFGNPEVMKFSQQKFTSSSLGKILNNAADAERVGDPKNRE